MDDVVTVLGFRVNVKRDGKQYVMTIPELPGCIGQTDSIDRVIPEMELLIKSHLKEIASRKPANRERAQGNVERLKHAATRRR